MRPPLRRKPPRQASTSAHWRRINNAEKWREHRAAALSPLAPQYALYGRMEAKPGVSLSPLISAATNSSCTPVARQTTLLASPSPQPCSTWPTTGSPCKRPQGFLDEVQNAL